MSYSKNKITVKEGMGGSAGFSSALAVVGISEITYPDIITISSMDEIEKKFGDGPLRDFLVDAYSFDTKPVSYVLAIPGSIKGTKSAVKVNSANTGVGSITVSGDPHNEYAIELEIVSSGGLNNGTFSIKVDERLIVNVATIPDTGTYILGNTGLTLTFVPGSPVGEAVSFASGDIFSLKTTAPTATNEELLDAVNKLLATKKKYRLIAIPHITEMSFWAAFDSILEMETDKNKFVRGVTMCRDVSNAETPDQYVNAMSETERGIIQCKRVGVVLSRAAIADSVNGNSDVRSVIGKYVGWLLRNKIFESPAKTANGAISGILDFAYYIEGSDSVKFSEGHLKTLDKSGFITVRNYYEKDGIFFTSGRMLVDETSDFGEIMNCSVMDKACTLVAERLFPYFNKDEEIGADGSIQGIDYIKSWGQKPLTDMKNIYGEISGGTFIVPKNQDLLLTKELSYFVDIIPKGYIVSLRGEIRFINPSTGGN